MTSTALQERTATVTLTTRLSVALAVVSTLGSGLTLVVPDVLNGTPAMNGSARGTALVMLIAGVPSLLGATFGNRAIGLSRATLLWLGTLGYFAYNSLLFLLATPFNELFLIYVAMMSLSTAALAALALTLDAPAAARHLPAGTARGLATYLALIVIGNTVVWLSHAVPGLADADAPDFLRGTGLTTNPIFVQDLSFWLPLGALAAVWLWQRKPWGVVLGGGYLSMWVLEGLSVAVDQWVGSRADPASSVVSASLVLPFLILSVICLIALTVMLRDLDGATMAEESPSRR